MPALTGRDQYESAIVAELAPIFLAQYQRTLDARSLADVSYGRFQGDLGRAMTDQLYRVFTAAGYALVIGRTLVISNAAFESSARQWCDKTAREIASSVTETSDRMTRELWRGARGDKQAFATVLQAVYLSPSRLDSIAITEVTRAASQAEQFAVFMFPENRQQRLIPIWITVEEAPGIPAESVCPICAPFDRHSPEVYGREFPGGPPAHPRCRCHREWYTAAELARLAA